MMWDMAKCTLGSPQVDTWVEDLETESSCCVRINVQFWSDHVRAFCRGQYTHWYVTLNSWLVSHYIMAPQKQDSNPNLAIAIVCVVFACIVYFFVSNTCWYQCRLEGKISAGVDKHCWTEQGWFKPWPPYSRPVQVCQSFCVCTIQPWYL